MGGNIGTQSSAFTVMTLYNKNLDYTNVLKEGAVGLITGVVCSLIVAIVTSLFIKDASIILAVSLALFINMIVGAMIGAFMPALLKRLDVDPSIISAPLISTILDITGIAVYIGIITLVLSKIV